MRRQFRLLKDTFDWKCGAIVEEDCDDGTQNFTLKTPVSTNPGSNKLQACRGVVIDNPEWFEEIEPLWVPANLYDKVMEFFKTL